MFQKGELEPTYQNVIAVGTFTTEHECAATTLTKYPDAKGVTYYLHDNIFIDNKNCWANRGCGASCTIVNFGKNASISCFFPGKYH